MSKSRRQDTKPDRSDRDIIRQLKATIAKLRKEVSQLRRVLGKREDVSSEYHDLMEEVTLPENLEPKKSAHCPQCSGAVSELDLGKFVILTCSNCAWRTRKK